MRKLLPLLLIALVLTGCGGKQAPLTAEAVAGLEVHGVAVELEDEEIAALVQEFNQAKYRRRDSSGKTTHMLVVITGEGARYTLYRIDEEKLEVGFRHEEQRRKFFLLSPALSELVAEICDRGALEAGQ